MIELVLVFVPLEVLFKKAYNRLHGPIYRCISKIHQNLFSGSGVKAYK